MTFEEMNVNGAHITREEYSKFYATMADEYRDALNTARAELRKVYLKILDGVKPIDRYNVLLKYNRLESLIKRIQTAYTEASIAAGKTTREASLLAITNNFYRQQYALAFAHDAIKPIQLSFSVLNPIIAEVSVATTPEVWTQIREKAAERLSEKWGDVNAYIPRSGTNLTELLVKNRRDDLLKIRRSITKGLINGNSYTQVAKEIKKIMDTSVNNAIRIARTEGNRNLNSASFANFNKAQYDGVEGLFRQIVSTFDIRTRQQSQEVSGRIDTGSGFEYPGGVIVFIPGNSGIEGWDINDREIATTMLEGFPPTSRRGRDPYTGENKVMNYDTFDSWAESNGLVKNKSGRWVKSKSAQSAA